MRPGDTLETCRHILSGDLNIQPAGLMASGRFGRRHALVSRVQGHVMEPRGLNAQTQSTELQGPGKCKSEGQDVVQPPSVQLSRLTSMRSDTGSREGEDPPPSSSVQAVHVCSCPAGLSMAMGMLPPRSQAACILSGQPVGISHRQTAARSTGTVRDP